MIFSLYYYRFVFTLFLENSRIDMYIWFVLIDIILNELININVIIIADMQIS